MATIGSVLTAALQLGLAAGATELAVAYASEREQFGKVIGQFQAVKHLCADMISRVEVARAAVYFAAVALDDPTVGDAAHAASVARIVAGDAASANGRDGIQVHGGIDVLPAGARNLFADLRGNQRRLRRSFHIRITDHSSLPMSPWIALTN